LGPFPAGSQIKQAASSSAAKKIVIRSARRRGRAASAGFRHVVRNVVAVLDFAAHVLSLGKIAGRQPQGVSIN